MSEPTIRLSRRGRRENSSSGSRKWNVLIDGVSVGQIAHAQTLDVVVTPGAHVLRIAARPILCSPTRSFDASNDQVIEYVCRPRSLSPFIFTRWLLWLLLTLVDHDRWISLDYVDTTWSPVAPARDAASTSTSIVHANLLASSPVSSRSTASSVLVVEHLTKHFGERTAFSDVSFDVGYGEVFGFLGPNGAGKTTTVRTLGTLIAPTSGTATVAGISLQPENGVEIRQHVAIMPEAPGLYLRLTVFENLEFFAGLYGLHHAEGRIKEALEAVHLGDRASDLCGGLSKGLRQRVGLARTLLSEPAIMFLDEPTSGLDPVASLDVHNLILGLRERGISIFLTTHRLDEAEKLCDRVAIMNTTLRTVGTPQELRERLFKKTLVAKTAASLDEPEGVFHAVPGVESWHLQSPGTYLLTVSDTKLAAPGVVRALVNASADVLSIAEEQHSLEDVYLELVNQKAEVVTS